MPVFEKGHPRPAGAGRKKGTPNRASAARQIAVEASGLTPLEHLLAVMRDVSQDVAVRVNAAKAAAPFVHPRLATVELHGEQEAIVVVHDWRGKGE